MRRRHTHITLPIGSYQGRGLKVSIENSNSLVPEHGCSLPPVLFSSNLLILEVEAKVQILCLRFSVQSHNNSFLAYLSSIPRIIHFFIKFGVGYIDREGRWVVCSKLIEKREIEERSLAMAGKMVDAEYLKEIESAKRSLRALIYSKNCAPIMLRLAYYYYN